MQDDLKQALIVSQNASTAAANIVAACVAGGVQVDDAVELYKGWHATILSTIQEAAAANALASAFDGQIINTPGPQRQAPQAPQQQYDNNVSPFPTPPGMQQHPSFQQQPVPQPAGAHQFTAQAQPPPAQGPQNMSPEDQVWMEYFNDPSQWYDNRSGKQNPKAPDFRHKSKPDPKNSQFKLSLWVERAPAWAKQRLMGQSF